MADTTPKKLSSNVTLHQHCRRSSRNIAKRVGAIQSTVSRVVSRGESTPERRSGKRIVACTAFRLEFLVHKYVGYLFLFNSSFFAMSLLTKHSVEE